MPPAARLELAQKPDLIGRHEITNGELKATITANSQETTYHVAYGPGSSFGAQSEEFTVPASVGAEPVTEVVELPLEPNSHYAARAARSRRTTSAT